jgi:hypothetical protein
MEDRRGKREEKNKRQKREERRQRAGWGYDGND